VVPATVTRRPARAGLQNQVHHAFGLRSIVGWALQSYLKDGIRVFYSNINPGKALFVSLVDLEVFATWYTG
jgi:hypothetical protein